MIINHIIEALSDDDSSRIVIIGGGTVGLYAAHELVKKGKEVLVIESGEIALGGFNPDSFSSVGKHHEGIRIGRSKSLGGTSNLWGGQLVEFQPADFIGREWLPDSKWPVSYDEIASYHQRTYENLGIPKEFTDDLKILRQSGVSEPEFGNGLELFLTRWLKIPSLSVAYAHEIQTSDKLKVLLNHTVTGFEGSDGNIAAVRITNHEGGSHFVKGGCFILASGTIEISRLLLHAASSTEWECPWRDNENVGAYFQDHLIGRVGSVEIIDRQRFFNTFSTIVRSGHKFQPKVRLSDRMLRQSRILNIHAMMSFESSISENLVYLKQFLKAAIYSRKVSGIKDFIVNLHACGKHLLPLMWKYVVENRVFVPSTSKVSFNIQSEQVPLKESCISIDPSVKDASGLPRVILNWKVGNEELPSIREFTILSDQALHGVGLARLHLDKKLEDLNLGFLDVLRDNYHHVGGARMGESERDGVVDKNLLVFGTTNLYAAGAATFRTASNANTTFTALTFVTRLVEQLTGKMQNQSL